MSAGRVQPQRDAIGREQERLKSTWVTPQSLPAEVAERVLGKPIEREYSLMDLLKRPGWVTPRWLSFLNEMHSSVTGRSPHRWKFKPSTKGMSSVSMRKSRARSATKRWHCRAISITKTCAACRSKCSRKLNQHKPRDHRTSLAHLGYYSGAISLLLVHLKRGIGAPERSAA